MAKIYDLHRTYVSNTSWEVHLYQLLHAEAKPAVVGQAVAMIPSLNVSVVARLFDRCDIFYVGLFGMSKIP